MSPADALVVASVLVCAGLAGLVALRSEMTRARGGKILAFVALFLLPVLSIAAGFETQMDRAQTTKFCLSCHVMTDYGRSLLVDDPGYIAAVHFQNNRVPRDRACYTCHTNYALFGTVKAKMHGARHVFVQYLGTIPAPDQIKLYEPYNNRECLHCHDGARTFEEFSSHNKTPQMLGDIKAGKLTCTSSRCHDTIHDVGSLADVKFWKESFSMITRLERRLRVAGLLIVAGLLVQLAASLFVHPLAFVAFLLLACPLVAAGVLVFLWGLVSTSGDTISPNPDRHLTS